MRACTFPWYGEPDVLASFVADLIAAEVSRLRPGSPRLTGESVSLHHRLDEDGVGLDSLERLTVASVLTATLHLQESGLEDLLLARRAFRDWVDICARALNSFSDLLTFHTSGSNGKPKACTHSLQTLLQEVAFLATLFEHTRRILYTVPTHHIYGFLFAVLLPAQLQVPRLDVRQMTARGLQKRLQPGDLIVSHPAHWSVLATHAIAFPTTVVGVTSTAPCPAAVARDLLGSGLQQLIQVYGSSETAGIGWRDNPAQTYRLMPFWSRGQSDPTVILRTDPDGSVRAVEPQDHLSWQDEIHFTPVARKDEAVQVNGTNVFPARIRQKLLEHPQVVDAVVRLMRPDEGNRLKAFVVPTPGSNSAILVSDLSIWASTQLTAPELPKSFTIGAKIPATAHGKLADWAI